MRAKNIDRNNLKQLQPLEILELDIQGPFKVSATNGTKLNLKIVDKKTGFVKLDFLTSKTATAIAAAFKRYHVRMERQTGNTIKRIRVDGDEGQIYVQQFPFYLDL